MKLRIVLSILIFVTASNGFAAMSSLRPAAPKRSKLDKVISFTENWRRYPAPDVIIERFWNDFLQDEAFGFHDDCMMLNSDNRAVLGDNEPATGRPVVEKPNVAFFNWYTTCLAEVIKGESEAIRSKIDRSQSLEDAHSNAKSFYTEAVVNECKLPSKSIHNLAYIGSLCRWRSLSAEAKAELVREQILRFIGPEDVVIDLEIAKSEQELIAQIIEQVDKEDGGAKMFQVLGVSNVGADGISLDHSLMVIKFLVNLTDHLVF